MTTFVLVVEALGSKYQAVVGVLSGVPFAIGELLFAVVRKSTGKNIFLLHSLYAIFSDAKKKYICSSFCAFYV